MAFFEIQNQEIKVFLTENLSGSETMQRRYDLLNKFATKQNIPHFKAAELLANAEGVVWTKRMLDIANFVTDETAESLPSSVQQPIMSIRPDKRRCKPLPNIYKNIV